MRRTPYSMVDVNRVCVGEVVAGRCGQACVVGVDVAKSELVACVYWPDRSFGRPWRASAPGQIGVLVGKLVELRGSPWGCPVVVAMESSGTYGDAFRQAAADAGIEVRRVSGKAVKDHAEAFDGVPSQHDGKDAAVIAELCHLGKGRAWAWAAAGEADGAIRYWVRRLDAAHRVKQVWAGKLEGLLARHWPEAGGLLKQC